MQVKAFTTDIKPTTWVALMAICLSVIACNGGSSSSALKAANNANTPNNGNCTNSGSGGGCDASGGDLLAPTKAEIEAAFKIVTDDLKNGLLTKMLNNLNEVGEPARAQQIYDNLAGAGSYQLVTDFLQIQADKKSKTDQAVRTGRIQFTTSEELCPSKKGQHDGSALRDLDDGKICISIKGFLIKPQKDLRQEMLAMLIHEISHLAGFDEDKATAIQRLISEHPAVYQDDFNDTKFNQSSKCSTENEIKEIESSHYWQLRLSEIQNYLGSQVNCSGKQTYTGAFQVYSNLKTAVEMNGKSSALKFKIDTSNSGTNLHEDNNTPELLRSPYTSDFNTDLGWAFASNQLGIKVSKLTVVFNIDEGAGKGIYVFQGLFHEGTECSHKQLIAQVKAAITVFSPLGCEHNHLLFSEKANLDKINALAEKILKSETIN